MKNISRMNMDMVIEVSSQNQKFPEPNDDNVKMIKKL